ncbi:MAG TPA: AsmA family protein [Bradyrhizobium sp.]|uniref:AsmA family protein n=1 Tax=Bradyrhizobium sp. TaxID=376 RepID=UPI002D8016E5|nr:AsmA family protein [Bradyrhizobium sp.]HET7886846.1 AsmA family protein [Bradyrhizobium sp.]
MRALKILGGVIAAVVVAAMGLLLVGMPAGFLTSRVADGIARATPYRLTVNGATRLGLWPSLNVSMSDVALERQNNRDDNGDRDNAARLTIGRMQADLTLSSLWSGHPEITELVIDGADLRIPLHRQRQAAASARAARPGADTSAAPPKIQRITVTSGRLIFFNTRDHVEDRIDGLSARAEIDMSRHLDLTGKARAGDHPLTFAVKASLPDPSAERASVPVEFSLEAPGLLQAPLSSEAQLRINGSLVMINDLSGKIGDRPFDGWASVDLASKPQVKLDLNFKQLDITTANQSTPQNDQRTWSNDPIELSGLNYVDGEARLSAAELNIGGTHFSPAALDASLASGRLKGTFANLGAYGGTASGSIELDVSRDVAVYTLRCDLNGVRALPLLSAAADFDKLDGKLQARIDVSSSGQSQQAILSNLAGTVSANFQDGAIRGLNVAQMIRALTSGTLSGWQQSREQSTDLSQLSASFRLDKGQATTADLNLVGPLVKVTGGGTVDIGAKTLSLRVDPKLVMTPEGQGRKSDPVAFGIPVVIDGPWDDPRLTPDIASLSGGGNADNKSDNQAGGNSLSDMIGGLIQQGLNAARRGNQPNPSPNDPSARPNNQINDIMKQLFGR